MIIKLLRIFMLISVILGLLTVVPARAQGDIGSTAFTFRELGYYDMQLNGLYGSSSVWIPFQSDWSVGNVEIELNYSATPLLNSESAILTIKANDQELTSIRPVGDGQNHTLVFSVPPEYYSVGGVNLTFDGYLRLTDEFCEDSYNAGQWMIIRNSSTVRVNLLDSGPDPILTDLPYAINVRGDIDPPSIVFVLPDTIDDHTLTTAAQAASRLGSDMLPNRLPFEVTTSANVTDQQKLDANFVLVGMPADLPLIWDLRDYMPAPPAPEGFASLDGFLIPPTDGVLQIFKSPWNLQRRILVVSGNGDSGLSLAGQALVHQPTFQSLSGSFQFIHSLVVRPLPLESMPWISSQTSFRQLGESDRQVTGLGITDTYYYFKSPPGILLDQGSILALHVAFSPALQEKNSYAVVYINDVYIGSIRIGETEGDSWVLLKLPDRVLNQVLVHSASRNLTVRLSIANLVPTNNCEQVAKGVSWTKIYADSYFQLNFVPVELPDLNVFPYPFAGLKDNNPLLIMIPDSPTQSELQTVLALASLIGNKALRDLNITVSNASALTAEDLGGNNLIMIGTPDRNVWLEELLAGLQSEMPVDLYQMLNVPSSGFFHEFASPWNNDMSAMALYGQSEASFNAAAAALFKNRQLVDEPGSVAAIRPENNPVIIFRESGLQPEVLLPEETVISPSSGTSDAVTNPDATSTPTPNELTGTERLILMIAVFLVILVALIALIRLAWRSRS